MVFWRKQKNEGQQERDERDDKFIHHPREPQLEPTEDEAALDRFARRYGAHIAAEEGVAYLKVLQSDWDEAGVLRLIQETN